MTSKPSAVAVCMHELSTHRRGQQQWSSFGEYDAAVCYALSLQHHRKLIERPGFAVADAGLRAFAEVMTENTRAAGEAAPAQARGPAPAGEAHARPPLALDAGGQCHARRRLRCAGAPCVAACAACGNQIAVRCMPARSQASFARRCCGIDALLRSREADTDKPLSSAMAGGRHHLPVPQEAVGVPMMRSRLLLPPSSTCCYAAPDERTAFVCVRC